MRRNLDDLRNRTFDLVIVGGGISGACMAHDAALRGLSVALVEQNDFASATSSASSKLIHGGIRYLQQIQLSKVRESAEESATFQKIAPHLARFVPFLIPTDTSLARGRAVLASGLRLYRLLSIGLADRVTDPAKRPPPPHYYTRDQVTAMVPLLADDQKLTGAYALFESHMHDSERTVVAFLQAAVQHGAAVANYVRVDSLLTGQRGVEGVQVKDELSGAAFSIRGRIVANVAGPWLMELNRSLGIANLHRNVHRFSKGVHIVTRELEPRFALALSTGHKAQAVIDRGGRHIFVIPWRGHSLIGTTNVPFDGHVNRVTVSEADVAGLLADVNHALPHAALARSDVRYAFAGLYPLTDDVIRPDVYQGTGTYQIVDHFAKGQSEGIISVLGAKYTTARRLAQLSVDLVERKLRRPVTPCRTDTEPVAGGDIADLERFVSEARDRYSTELDGATVDHLVAGYGTSLTALLGAARHDTRALARLSPHREAIEAEVSYAVSDEMALHLDDVVFRRTGLGTIGHPGTPCLERCAAVMAGPLGWTTAQVVQEVERVERRFHIS